MSRWLEGSPEAVTIHAQEVMVPTGAVVATGIAIAAEVALNAWPGRVAA